MKNKSKLYNENKRKMVLSDIDTEEDVEVVSSAGKIDRAILRFVILLFIIFVMISVYAAIKLVPIDIKLNEIFHFKF